jgi:hypothetical protein
MEEMHDWTLLSISLDWKAARVTVLLRTRGRVTRTLIGNDVVDIKIPKRQEWGPSVSVNHTSEVTSEAAATTHLKIEMQTGDVIEIVAGTFTLT